MHFFNRKRQGYITGMCGCKRLPREIFIAEQSLFLRSWLDNCRLPVIELIFDHNLNFWDEETEKTISSLKANNSREGKQELSRLN